MYYPIPRIPEFWDWLTHVAIKGKVKVPVEIHNEIVNGTSKDQLKVWASERERKKSLLLNEDVSPDLLELTLNTYAPDLNTDEIMAIGMDCFLIAYALADKDNRTVVTSEVSKRTQPRSKKRVPDICEDLGIDVINPFELYEILDFRTNWNNGLSGNSFTDLGL